MKKSYTLFIYIVAILLIGFTACDDGNNFGSGYIPSLQKSEIPPVTYHTTATTTSLVFEATAASKDITVTSNEEWTALSDTSSWCTVSPAIGSKGGSVKVIVTDNTSTSSRTATITIKGKSSGNETIVRVTQEPPTTPEYDTTATPASLEFEEDATDSPQTITVISNEEWTATSSETSWCTISPTSGNGSGTIKVTVTKPSSNSATITIRGKYSDRRITVTVTQKRVPPVTTAAPTSLTFNPNATDSHIIVTSNEEWTATSNKTSWCTVLPASGSKNGTVKVTVTKNTSTLQRDATIIIKGKASGDETKIMVTQYPESNSTIDINPFGDDENWDK